MNFLSMGRGIWGCSPLGPWPCHLLGNAPAAAGRKTKVEQKEWRGWGGHPHGAGEGERVRSQARCLIEWLRGPSAGASPAPRRWQWVSHEEQRFGRERMAHLISLVQGHHALRQGQFPLWFLTISHFYSALEVMYVSQSVSGHYWCDSGEYFDLHPVWINVSKLKKKP